MTFTRNLWLAALAVLFVLFASPLQATTLLWTNAAGDGDASNGDNWYNVATQTFGAAPASSSEILLNASFSDGMATGSADNIHWGASATHTVASWNQVNYTGVVNFDITYDNVNSNGFHAFTVASNLTINDGSWTHTVNGKGFNAADRDVHRLRVDVGGDFTLGADGKIDVTSKGYLKGAPGFNGGGGHGGAGGGSTHNPATYGSILDPLLHGAGGGTTNEVTSDGGGAVYFTVAGHSTVDGEMRANVTSTTGNFNRAAAGGSVVLRTGTLSGAGSLEAKGGDSNGGSNTGDGGGGRIAVILTDGAATFDTFNGTLNTQPGVGGASPARAAGGSIYLQDGSQTMGQGRVVIDFVNRNGDVDTHKSHVLTAEDLSAASVAVQRQGHLRVTSSKTIGSLETDASSNVTINSGQTLATGGNGDDTIVEGAIHGAGHLTKNGAGMMTLAGVNTYTGITTVNDGTLLVTGELTGAGNVVVNSGATLGGDGNIAGTVVIEDGGHLSPGASPGTLTVGGLTLNEGSAITFELGSLANSLVVEGLLTGPDAAGGVTLNVLAGDGFEMNVPYVLIDWGSAPGLSLEDFHVVTDIFGSLAMMGQSLTFTGVVIPEPSTLALLALGALALPGRRRRRR